MTNTNYDEIEILLVEDNMSDAELTIRALAKAGIANHLFHVKDGSEALDFIFFKGEYAGRRTKSNPKLVLLDIKMPKIDGIDVLRKIKQDEKTKMIPVVIMTSSRQEQDIVSSYKLGVNAYVVKPVDFEGFSKAVRHLGLFWLLVNQPPPGL